MKIVNVPGNVVKTHEVAGKNPTGGEQNTSPDHCEVLLGGTKKTCLTVAVAGAGTEFRDRNTVS